MIKKELKIAVLIAVYQKDNACWFEKAINSILDQNYNQELIRIYLIIDGKLPNSIENYIQRNKSLFYKVIRNTSNLGLALSLNKGIATLENEAYIFRMDADDISFKNRISTQVNFMENNPDIMLSGGSIIEKSENGSSFIRTYPRSIVDISKYICKASPFAHVTVCFRGTLFQNGVFYPNSRYNEDIILWFALIKKGVLAANIDTTLVEVRKTKDFYNRRGLVKALEEYKTYCKGIISLHGFTWKLIYPQARLILRLMPSKITEIVYNSKFLRGGLNAG